MVRPVETLAMSGTARASEVKRKISDAFEQMEERRTGARRAIARGLVGLAQSGDAFSAEQLLKRLRRGSPRIGRATVYRSMERLVRMGVLDRIEFSDGTHSFRLCESGHHHHLACTKCHRVVELDLCLESDRIAAVGEQQDFEIAGHSITLFGLCRKCRPGTLKAKKP